MFKLILCRWKGSIKNPVIHPYKCGQSAGFYGRYSPRSLNGITIGVRWGER